MDSLPSPPAAPPDLAMTEAIAKANEAIECDRASMLKPALDAYVAAAEQLQSWLQAETRDAAAVKAVKERVLGYVQRAELVKKRLDERQHQFENRIARQHDKHDPNVLFYRGEITSYPNGDFVDNIHKWYGDWDKLEDHHGYIQWIFPYFDPRGHNCLATPLSKSGAAAIREDETCQRRVLSSYKMMLHFYGFVLADEKTGRVERLADEREFRERIGNINDYFHNNVRISRILTSLGQMGFHRYKRPFFDRLQAEVDAGTLKYAADSCRDFWKPIACDEGTEAYKDITLEEPEDRAEGCLFRPGGAFAG